MFLHVSVKRWFNSSCRWNSGEFDPNRKLFLAGFNVLIMLDHLREDEHFVVFSLSNYIDETETVRFKFTCIWKTRRRRLKAKNDTFDDWLKLCQTNLVPVKFLGTQWQTKTMSATFISIVLLDVKTQRGWMQELRRLSGLTRPSSTTYSTRILSAVKWLTDGSVAELLIVRCHNTQRAVTPVCVAADGHVCRTHFSTYRTKWSSADVLV